MKVVGWRNSIWISLRWAFSKEISFTGLEDISARRQSSSEIPKRKSCVLRNVKVLPIALSVLFEFPQTKHSTSEVARLLLQDSACPVALTIVFPTIFDGTNQSFSHKCNILLTNFQKEECVRYQFPNRLRKVQLLQDPWSKGKSYISQRERDFFEFMSPLISSKF